nr:hypothetical protein [uncultured Gellertiella sp.]
MDLSMLGLAFLLISWFIGAGIFVAIGWFVGFVTGKIFKKEFGFRFDVVVLLLIAAVEPFIWHTGIDRTFSFDLSHVLSSTIPSLIVAVLLTRWINAGKD